MKEYHEKYAKMLIDYTRMNLDDESRLRNMSAMGLPSLEKFAVRINVTRAALDVWAREHVDFAEAMQEARARICDMMCDMGATKSADPSFIRFLLVTKYGYDEDCDDKTEEKPFELVLTVVK